jgi:lipoic acid synthetase
MHDLRTHRVDILTLGQYLRPSPRHLPIVRYVPPAEFDDLRRAGYAMGFRHVEAGPLVRSSFHASDAVA